jgi:hypothetical protein
VNEGMTDKQLEMAIKATFFLNDLSALGSETCNIVDAINEQFYKDNLMYRLNYNSNGEHYVVNVGAF